MKKPQTMEQFRDRLRVKGWSEKQITRYIQTGKRPYSKKAIRSNPVRGTEIYAHALCLYAEKGPGHHCDAKCKQARHQYKHKFKRGVRVLGMPNGDVLLRSKNK